MGPGLALLGLGSSLGQRERALELAVRLLARAPGVELLRLSRAWSSRPMGEARGGFLNAALLIRSSHSPRGLLGLCKAIEARVGRRVSPRWTDRLIDLDILWMEGIRRSGPGLTLPHPGLAQRDFALLPALEIAPELRLPGTERCLADLPPPRVRTGCAPVGVLVAGSTLARAIPAAYPQPRPLHPLSAQGPAMKIFLDTANLDEIREAHSWGVIDGVTTNPSLIAREGRDFVETIDQICEIVQGPVSAETVATNWEGMVKEGRLLAQVSEHVVVKIPLTIDGIRATRVLADDGIDVNVTLCFQAAQALLAAKAGAAYISPFIGRLDDLSIDGVQLIEQIVQIYMNYPDLNTQVLAASIRHPLHVAQVATAGAHVATIPFSTLKKLVNHPLTDSGLKQFLADWAGVPDPDVAGAVERFLAKRDKR